MIIPPPTIEKGAVADQLCECVWAREKEDEWKTTNYEDSVGGWMKEKQTFVRSLELDAHSDISIF